MGYGSLQSPGIQTTQTDLTAVVPAVPTSQGGFAGVMRWGPLDEVTVLDSEDTLTRKYLGPTNHNAETFFTAANFLSYTNYLNFCRAGDWTGNTVVRTYSGNSTDLAATTNSNVISVTNTSGLLVGMQLFHSNATGIPDALTVAGNPVITAITNATSLEISENATANVQSVELVFREDVCYASVAQETEDATIDWDSQAVRNESQYAHVDGTFDSSVIWVARYLGKAGDSLRIAQCDTPSQFTSSINLVANSTEINSTASFVQAIVGSNSVTITVTPANTSNATYVTAANTLAGQVADSLQVGDLVQTGNSTLGYQYLSVVNVGSVSNTGNVYSIVLTMDDEYKLGANSSNPNFVRYWEFYNEFSQPPGTSQYVTTYGNSAATDELHLVIVDELGAFSSNPGTILEKYQGLSRATDAQAVDGGSNYVKTVVNNRSQYVYFANPRSVATVNTAAFITSSTGTHPLNVTMYGGNDGPDESSCALADLTNAYSKFASEEDFPDVSLLIQGKARGESVSSNTQLGNYIVDNICEVRGDVMTFTSPDKSTVVNNQGSEATSIKAARLNMRYSSYQVIDSGYKYQYDKYNDLYRWIPLNGDIAGLCARTDLTNDAWWSPAGYIRGKVKNVVRLAYNPKQADRDLLFNNDVNPVITQAGAGTLLFGDKTSLGLSSAFSRINVQRLFIVLKKAIKRLAKQFMFEFNDDFTRAQFRNIVNPYLKLVQGRRGIEDFIVICDTSNNGPEVRMNNQFVASIGIKPTYSINFIYLNFTAVRADVSFSTAFGT